VNVGGCDLQKSFYFDKTVKITGYVPSTDYAQSEYLIFQTRRGPKNLKVHS